MSIIRVISNGYGEDAIAARLISAIGLDVVDFDAFPLVGDGRAYVSLGLTPKLKQEPLPSGGFLLRINDVLTDFRSGLFTQFQKQRRVLSEAQADYQLVVGDVFALFMATLNNTIPTVFFPTAKSERAIPHFGLECRFIRSNAHLVFPRDIETHQLFHSKQLPSRFFGNPMFDGMVSNAPQGDPPIVALLPGSRQEAFSNMVLMLDVVEQLNLKEPFGFVFSLPSHFRYAQLKFLVDERPWCLEKQGDDYFFRHSQHPLTVHVSYQFYDVLQASSVVIGLAGTANEQAMHAKRPLISFIGSGPQSTRKRFIQQHQLIEDAQTTLINSNDSSVIATAVSKQLNQSEFQWTPLADHYQHVSADIVRCLDQEFFI